MYHKLTMVYNVKRNIEANKSVICLTAYKAYVLFKYLLNSPLSMDEIIQLYQENSIIDKKFSKDTIRITINTLRELGCEIDKPTPTNGNKYILRSHPFGLNLTLNQLNALEEIEKDFATSNNWQLVIEVGKLWEKIALLTNKEEVIEKIRSFNPFNNIDEKILEQLKKHCKNKSKIQVSYFAPREGNLTFDIICDYISSENEKLYIWCYNFKYESVSYLRIDRILKIISVYTDCQKLEYPQFDAIYTLKGQTRCTFLQTDNDELLETTNEYIKIKSTVLSEFNFMQKVLSYGNDCKIIEPSWLKTKLITKLNLMKAIYYDKQSKNQ